ncbi:hypothetical protein ACVDG2_19675 [Pseudosulfitobacter sp. RP-4]
MIDNLFKALHQPANGVLVRRALPSAVAERHVAEFAIRISATQYPAFIALLPILQAHQLL